MHAARLKSVARATCAGLLAVLFGGCIIPGINEENDDAARGVADFGSLAPRRITPTQTEGVLPTVVQLSWTNVAGAVSYDLHLGPDTNPPLIVTTTNRSFVVRELPECTVQYWRVVATDADGAIVSSPVWSFKTECR